MPAVKVLESVSQGHLQKSCLKCNLDAQCQNVFISQDLFYNGDGNEHLQDTLCSCFIIILLSFYYTAVKMFKMQIIYFIIILLLFYQTIVKMFKMQIIYLPTKFLTVEWSGGGFRMLNNLAKDKGPSIYYVIRFWGLRRTPPPILNC